MMLKRLFSKYRAWRQLRAWNRLDPAEQAVVRFIDPSAVPPGK